MIRLMVDNNAVDIKWIEFSDGAITCQLMNCPEEFHKTYITVDPSTKVKDILTEILLVRGALIASNFLADFTICLYLPYMPYGRADRVFEHGNPLPLYEFFSAIEEVFDEVITVDIHNEDTLRYYPITNIPQSKIIKQVLDKQLQEYDYVVAPDAGAQKKIYELGMPVITATKTRDVSTGKLISTTLDTDVDLKGLKLLIVDDICDYGGTFLNLGKLLKEKGAHVDLYVTHMIAPEGLTKFKGIIDKVYCYHTVGGYLNMTSILDYNNGKY